MPRFREVQLTSDTRKGRGNARACDKRGVLAHTPARALQPPACPLSMLQSVPSARLRSIRTGASTAPSLGARSFLEPSRDPVQKRGRQAVGGALQRRGSPRPVWHTQVSASQAHFLHMPSWAEISTQPSSPSCYSIGLALNSP